MSRAYAAHVPNRSRMSCAYAAHMSFRVPVPPLRHPLNNPLVVLASNDAGLTGHSYAEQCRMNGVSQTEARRAETLDPAIEVGTTFLRALFSESDTILFRPIETWVEAGKKRSRVDYRNTCYRKAVPALLQITLRQLLKLAGQERLNLFFAVCRRLGTEGRFDLAWQIRTVRVLWADIDNVTVEEALGRVAKAALPIPSIVVNSGSGVHLYWLLDQVYLIDDVGDPPAVLTEWIDGKEGKKRPRKFITEAGSNERLYLDVRANVPDLSPKAICAQDVLAGIAAAIGGDHTQDLSRLLRLPGSLNRKDERNGRSPLACELVKCDPTLKYPFGIFATFADRSPDKARRQQIAAVALPLPKALTPTKHDKLNALITACATAPVGERSGADWHLVCTAIERGWPQAEVWGAVASVGKFAEAGEPYFFRTWAKAVQHTRERIFKRAVSKHRKRGETSPVVGNPDDDQTDGEEDADEGDPGLIASLAKSICETEHFAQDAGGKLYRFHNGVYQARGEAFVKIQVKRLCTKLHELPEWSSHLANEVVEFIRVDSSLLWERPPDDVINVQNGLLNVTSRKLSPHTSDHLSAVQLPVDFDPAATCPRIDKFIAEVFPGDATTLAYEIPAWLMLAITFIQRAILLIGSGGNGKSRYLAMVEAFLGRSNVVNLSLHRIEADRFSCARLYGKLANICPDLPTEHLSGTSMFKAITGGDPITGEYKFKDSFDFVPFCRLVFSANTLPRAKDSSEGFFDRWHVVPFERRFRGEAREIPSATLDAMLSAPGEQSGMLNRALDVLPRLLSTGRFTESESTARAFDEFRAATDPLSVWLDSQTLEEPNMLVTKRDLMVAFGRHSDEIGRPPMTSQAFGAAFRKLRPDVSEGQRTVHGKVQWCWLGIGLKEAPASNSE
jgi:P4 family phage/plasmid primase-like protien